MSLTIPLNLDDAQIALGGQLLTRFLREYEQGLGNQSVLPVPDRRALTALLNEPFPQRGLGIEQVFEQILSTIVPNSTAISHPRFLAYVQGPPNGFGAFAEAIAATLNQNCNFWQLSPAASVVERKVVAWLAHVIGLPESAGGLVTSGGSMATCMAIAAALHDKSGDDFRTLGLQGRTSPLVVYTSIEAHHCVEKSAAMLGVGLRNVRRIPVDASLQMQVDALEAAVRADFSTGKRPACVVATAGTVKSGAIDPIARLATFCRAHDLWLHVDGAYGGLFSLASRVKDRLRACGEADSIALDPHKLLFAPLEAGCLVARDPTKLQRAFAFPSSYLPAQSETLFTDFMDYGIQLSRGFKALKIWCALQAFGVDAFVGAADRMLDLAQYMAERIEANPAFELLAPVTLSAICFRFRNLSDAQNRAALEALTASGLALLGPVQIEDRFGLRACITNYRTTQSDVDAILKWLCDYRASLATAL